MNSAVIVFPGSNCDRDLATAIELVTGKAPVMVWHRETRLPGGTGFIAVPGGFSYGDYLRSGAMAARSPIMRAVADAAGKGTPVLGICNGFQVLTEAGLPAMQRAQQFRQRPTQQIVLGPFFSRADAVADLRRLQALGGYDDARVVTNTR